MFSFFGQNVGKENNEIKLFFRDKSLLYMVKLTVKVSVSNNTE